MPAAAAAACWVEAAAALATKTARHTLHAVPQVCTRYDGLPLAGLTLLFLGIEMGFDNVSACKLLYGHPEDVAMHLTQLSRFRSAAGCAESASAAAVVSSAAAVVPSSAMLPFVTS